jgi:hypothetical protein
MLHLTGARLETVLDAATARLSRRRFATTASAFTYSRFSARSRSGVS